VIFFKVFLSLDQISELYDATLAQTVCCQLVTIGVIDFRITHNRHDRI
jgi:hypothetical protein